MIPFAQKQNRFVTTCCLVERTISNKRRTIHTGGNNVGTCVFCFGSNNERTHSSRKQRFFDFVSVQLFLLFVVCLVCFSRPSPGFFSFVVTRHSNPFNFPLSSSSSFTLFSLTHFTGTPYCTLTMPCIFPIFAREVFLLSPPLSHSLTHSNHTHTPDTDRREESIAHEKHLFTLCV